MPEPATAPIDVLEALLFASDAPLEPERLRDVLDLGDVSEVRALVEELRARFESAASALHVTEIAGGYRMMTRPTFAPWLVRLARSRTRARLSRPALETLAIIGYRQPVSRPEIDAIRGVNSEGVLDSLLERRLARISGRKEAPGRPFLYETTREFLVAFGLRDVSELPKVDGELVVPEPAEATAATTIETGADGAPTTADGVETDARGESEASDSAEAIGDGHASTASADDITNSEHAGEIEERHGSPGAVRALGGVGGHFVAPHEVEATADPSGVVANAEAQTEQDPGASGHHVATGR